MLIREHTSPRSNDGSMMMFELSPGCHVLPSLEVQNVQFKRRKIGNVRLKEFINPLGKQFRVNDLCEIEPLRPYNKDQFKSFNKWFAGVVDNTKPIEMGVGSGDIL